MYHGLCQINCPTGSDATKYYLYLIFSLMRENYIQALMKSHTHAHKHAHMYTEFLYIFLPNTCVHTYGCIMKSVQYQ